MIKLPISPILRNLRERRGISVRDLARRSKVHFNAIYRYERDENAPSLTSLFLICDTLGVEPWRVLRAAARLQARQAAAR